MEGAAAHDVQAGIPHGLYGPGRRLLVAVEHPFDSAIRAAHEAVDRYGHLQDQVSHRLLLALVRPKDGLAQSVPTARDLNRAQFSLQKFALGVISWPSMSEQAGGDART